MLCETINSHVKSFFFPQKFYFQKFHFFFLFYFILFYFILLKKFQKNFVMNSVHEQCPKSDSVIVLSQELAKCTATAQPARTGRALVVVSWPAQRRVAAPRACVARVAHPLAQRPRPTPSAPVPLRAPCGPACRAPHACACPYAPSAPARARVVRPAPSLSSFSLSPYNFIGQ